MMTSNLLEFAFIQRAYIAGGFIGILCAILGLFLLLRRLSLIGDGLSHVSFGAIALGLLFGIYPFYVAIPVAIAASLLILRLTQRGRLYGDAAIGIVSAVGVAIGVVFASLSHGLNVDLFAYLFGSILAISTAEVIVSVGLSLIIIIVIALFYNDLFSITFDEQYARITGINTEILNTFLTTLAAITVVLAIKVVGVLLASALLILPAATALQIAKGFRGAMFISALVAIASVLAGITIAFYADMPAGATVVLFNTAIFALALIFNRWHG